MEAFSWLKAHWEDVIVALAALYAFLRVVVLLTPTKADDEALDKFTLLVGTVCKVLGWKSPIVPADALPPPGVPLAPPPVPTQPTERNNKTGRASVEVLLALALALSLLAGCVSAGDQYQASSIAFVAAVDAATELRKAGKLNVDEIDEIGLAVDDGAAVLNAWAEALQSGRDYPDGAKLVSLAVERIRVRLRLRARRE